MKQLNVKWHFDTCHFHQKGGKQRIRCASSSFSTRRRFALKCVTSRLVMLLVIQVVNLIVAQALNDCRFKTLQDEVANNFIQPKQYAISS